jgi:DNA-binding GntR family transcriptional regulator
MKKMALNKNHPIPLYYQIFEDIRLQIKNHELNSGDKMPTEQWLTEHYQVSRVTVRKALSELLNAELIQGVRGKGSIVAHPRINRNAASLTGLHEEIAKAGMKPTSIVSDIKRVTAQGKLTEKMGVPEGEPLLSFKRLRLGDNVPIADQTIYLLESIFKGFNPIVLQEGSFYKLAEDEFGLKIDYAEQTIDVKKPTKKQAKELQLADNTSLLRMERTTYLLSGEVVEYTEICYVPSRYKLSMKLYK